MVAAVHTTEREQVLSIAVSVPVQRIAAAVLVRTAAVGRARIVAAALAERTTAALVLLERAHSTGAVVLAVWVECKTVARGQEQEQHSVEQELVGTVAAVAGPVGTAAAAAAVRAGTAVAAAVRAGTVAVGVAVAAAVGAECTPVAVAMAAVPGYRSRANCTVPMCPSPSDGGGARVAGPH